MSNIYHEDWPEPSKELEGDSLPWDLFGSRVDRGTFLKAGGAALLSLGLDYTLPASALAAPNNLSKQFGMIEIAAVSFFTDNFNNPLKHYLSPRGWSLNIVTEEGQPTRGYTEAAQFIAANYGIIAESTSDPMAGWVSTGRAAVRKGLTFMSHSPQALGPATQNIQFDHRFSGILVGRAAVQWAHRNNIKPVVGLLANVGDPEGKKRTDFAWKTVKQAFPAAKLAGEVNAVKNQQEGFSGAANLISAHPDINMLISFNTLAGLGAFNAARRAGKTDRNKFFLGTADYETAVGDLIKKGTIYQAAFGAYFPYSAVLMARDALAHFNGHRIFPTRRLGGRVIANGQQVTTYEDALRHPFSPKYRGIYNDRSIVAYSNRRLATAQSINTIFP